MWVGPQPFRRLANLHARKTEGKIEIERAAKEIVEIFL
jgi:hypothetical protein